MHCMKISPVQELPLIYLKPGEMYFGTEPARVVTVLGSCVSVIMYHRRTRIGAISHAVMPTITQPSRKSAALPDVFQYVDSSIDWMLARFRKMGVKHRELDVKIFGGSEIFYDSKRQGKTLSVGSKNVETAMKTIAEKELKLKAWNVGGNKGRKVIFYTDTGEVFTKFVSKVAQQLPLYEYGGDE
ncbi:MAG TPA: chemotaxis protein CheD [Deltaproteobacteria bacterium]|nr:chemotaxis protein CheD [Deltaproteobacteria bacterium]HQI82271.1 chemotaxis protein CheD [Deltaproteobacteria bacterium]